MSVLGPLVWSAELWIYVLFFGRGNIICAEALAGSAKRCSVRVDPCSTDPFWDHFSANIRESVIPALKSVSEFEVVESKLVQHGGVQVVDVHPIFSRVPPDFICFSIG